MMRAYRLCLPFLAAAVIAAGAAPDVAAQSLLSREDAKIRIEKGLEVEVLRLQEAEVDGRPAFTATIMNPSGNYNAAFQVNTVVLDRKTGELIHRFGRNGQAPAGGTIRSTNEDSGPAIRRQTFDGPKR